MQSVKEFGHSCASMASLWKRPLTRVCEPLCEDRDMHLQHIQGYVAILAKGRGALPSAGMPSMARDNDAFWY